MDKLIDLASVLRSKNAGPLYLTFDVIFSNGALYERVKKSNALNSRSISVAYGVVDSKVDIIYYDVVRAIKVTIPRIRISGDIEDSDVYGCQQYQALSQLLIP